MSKVLLVILLALLLGAAIAGSTYFVFSQEGKEFACNMPENSTTPQTYNTYQVTRRGFPFAFYTKTSAPEVGGCQRPTTQGGAIDAHADFSKQDFLKDFAIWAGASLAVITPLWLGGKKQ